MIYGKRKILIHRLICFALLLPSIIILIILSEPSKEVEIIDDNGYINAYYEYIDRTNCEIEVAFNCDVDAGYMTVAFYDSNGTLLARERGYFYGYGNMLSSTFIIDGKVDSYEILNYSIDRDTSIYVMIKLLVSVATIPIFIVFIESLLLSCKVYEYSGNEIVVYAGWYHHYITVNGTMTDEHNTLFFRTAILLSCTLIDGTDIKATITTMKRISLKINNLLYTKEK